MLDFGALLATVKGTSETLKFLRSAEKKFDEAELKGHLLTVLEGNFEIREALLVLKEELQNKDKEIEQLRDALNDKAELQEDGGLLFKVENGGIAAKAVCPKCFRKEAIVFYLVQDPGKHERYQKCPNCKTEYENPKIPRRLPQVRSAGRSSLDFTGF